ncbi:MAG: hypothetical protein Q8K78_17845 [Planctomycetaceae bacterium]|nr:hypothetical protein [Planctomycetaceae bacterium]
MGDALAMLRQLMIVLCAVVLLGCGRSGDGFTGDRGEVSGKVTIKGQPAPEGCSIIFQSKEGPNYSALGTVNANGEYSLLYNGKASLPAITYTATVIPPLANSSGTMSTEQMTTSAADMTKSIKSKVKPKLPFAASYSSALTSGLEFTVKKGPNKADFDLTP